MKQFILKMLSSDSNVSSKRVAGFMGGIICLIITCYCTYNMIPAPDVVELLFICSTSLIGLDSITSIGKPTFNKHKKEPK